MRNLIAIVMVFGVIGCAAKRHEPREWCLPNLGLCVIEVDRRDIGEMCKGVEVFDDGTIPGPNDEIYACFDPMSGRIVVRRDRKCALLHELGHADGRMGKEAIDFDWCD